MRRPGGRETWHRLLDWDRGQADSERLACRLLATQGFQNLDPSHPLGGPDGGRDLRCTKDGDEYLVAAYFPRGQQTDGAIYSKFDEDLAKARTLDATRLVFFTNQELTLAKRDTLIKRAPGIELDLYHLERVAGCLDTPAAYGIRLEFLSLEMTLEEQLSFINHRDQILAELKDVLQAFVRKPTYKESVKTVIPDMPSAGDVVGSLFGSKLVACKQCREVFRVNTLASTVFAHASLPTVVTCPDCGKKQALPSES